MWGGLISQSWAQGPQERTEPLQQFHGAKAGQPIAGIPFDEALKIFERHTEKLRQLPGVVSVVFAAEGLVVETTKPEAAPTSVEGLPVFAIPPTDPRAGMGIDEATSYLPLEAEPEPLPAPSPEVQEPPARPCAPGYTLDPVSGACLGQSPEPPRPKLQRTPPPPGVIVLKPGRIRERASACPSGFEEVQENGWRFCVDPARPEPIPPLWEPPIAGIPYEKALEIHHRHAAELKNLPGVTSVDLRLDGIHVSTNNPAVAPGHVEGLPIKIDPPEELMPTGHTSNNPVRPLHGANESHQDNIEEAVNVAQGALSTTW